MSLKTYYFAFFNDKAHIDCEVLLHFTYSWIITFFILLTGSGAPVYAGTYDDTIGVPCNPNVSRTPLDQLVEVVQKSEYFISRDMKLAINRNRIRDLLNKKDIVGIELVVAGPNEAEVASRWGHAMLRFVDSDNDWRNDYVISFVLDQNEEELNLGKAIFGGYPILPETKTFGEFWSQYVKGEGRPLNRIIMPTTAKMREELLTSFQNRSENPATLGTYTFLNNNCAGALGELLSDAGFPHLGKSSIPTHMEKWLQKSMMSPYPSMTITPPKETLKKASKLLGISYEELLAGENYPADTASLLEKKLDTKEQLVFYYQVDLIPSEVSNSMASKLSATNINIDDVYGLSSIAPEFYGVCRSVDCVKKNESLALNHWDKKELDKIKETRREIYFENYYEQTVESRIFGYSDTQGDAPSITHPRFDLDLWKKKKKNPSWLKKNDEIADYMRLLVLTDLDHNKDLLQKECGEKIISNCLH